MVTAIQNSIRRVLALAYLLVVVPMAWAPVTLAEDATNDSAAATAVQLPYHVDKPLYHVSGVVQVVHGPIAVESCNCGECLHCVDRDGQGLIGGFGMQNGIGPIKHRDDCQCWQCPYNAPFNQFGPGEYAGPANAPDSRISTAEWRYDPNDLSRHGTQERRPLSIGRR